MVHHVRVPALDGVTGGTYTITMPTTPCRDCAYTRHPGRYVSLVLDEPCRACGGSALEPAAPAPAPRQVEPYNFIREAFEGAGERHTARMRRFDSCADYTLEQLCDAMNRSYMPIYSYAHVAAFRCLGHRE